MKTVGATVLGGLWELEWAWHSAETNLRCTGISGICMPNPSIVAFIVSEISAFIRTDGQTDMARSTRLVILIKNIYTLWSRKRFLLPVTYFPTNLVYVYSTSNGYEYWPIGERKFVASVLNKCDS